jgi:hypothetical protein
MQVAIALTIPTGKPISSSSLLLVEPDDAVGNEEELVVDGLSAMLDNEDDVADAVVVELEVDAVANELEALDGDAVASERHRSVCTGKVLGWNIYEALRYEV